MAREPKCRRVTALPKYAVFKPAGTSRSKLLETVVKIEELEAIRLKDLLGLEQEDCADNMRVSRPTFQRILVEARRKIAEAIVEGKVIRIEGGDYCLGQDHCRRGQLFMKKAHCLYPLNEGQDGMHSEAAAIGIKIAICADDSSPSALIDGRFGRCAYFLLWDKLEHRLEALKNCGSELAQGAGTGAVEELLGRGIRTLVCNRIGPNAFTFFRKAGGQVFQAPQGAAIGEVLKELQAGQLKEITVPNHKN